VTQSVGSAFFGVEIPFLDLLGARPGHREKGRAVVSLELREKLTNSWGFAHGGVVMTLLDVAMGSAVRSTVPPGLGVVTVNLGVTFLHSAAGSLTAEGRVLRGGRTLVFCEGEARRRRSPGRERRGDVPPEAAQAAARRALGRTKRLITELQSTLVRRSTARRTSSGGLKRPRFVWQCLQHPFGVGASDLGAERAAQHLLVLVSVMLSSTLQVSC